MRKASTDLWESFRPIIVIIVLVTLFLVANRFIGEMNRDQQIDLCNARGGTVVVHGWYDVSCVLK